MHINHIRISKFISTSAKNLICLKPKPDSYSEFLKEHLTQYLDDLINLNSVINDFYITSTIREITRINNLIFKIADSYENGDVYTATNTFFKDLMFDPAVFSIIDMSIEPLDSDAIFYRARRNSINNNLEQKDMFHNAFSKRRKIVNYRFSINGYPCLYLSNCSYLCWEEMNRPNLHELCVSKYKYVGINNSIWTANLDPIIFNKRHIYNSLKKPFTNPMHWLCNLLTRIPLFFIFLNRVKEPDSNFKPEYIFPQMFTNFIKEGVLKKPAQGIKYPSTKVMDSECTFFNYIFFSYPDLCKGEYCDFLSTNFHFTEGFPITYSLINTNKGTSYNPPFASKLINMAHGMPTEYYSTIFFNHESILNSISESKLP